MATFLYWSLLIVVGVPMFLVALFMLLARTAVAINNSMRDPDWHLVPPEAIPGVPAARLRALAAEVLAKGYTEVAGYSLPAMSALGMHNYVFVFVAPDRLGYLEVFYIRCPWILRFMAAVFARDQFFTSVCSTALFAAWPDSSRLATTPTRQSANDSEPNDVSQILAGSTLDELMQAHTRRLSELVSERGEPLAFQTVADYRNFFRTRTQKAYDAGPKSVEELLEQQALDGDENDFRPGPPM